MNNKHNNKSIFIFFTWRDLNPNKTLKNEEILEINKLYVYNILKLLNDTRLAYELNRKNITLFFGLHQNLIFLKNYITNNFKFVKIINNEKISTCLLHTCFMLIDHKPSTC